MFPAPADLIPTIDPRNALRSDRKLWVWWLDMPASVRQAEDLEALHAALEPHLSRKTEALRELELHQAVAGRIWWACGKVVNRFTAQDVLTLSRKYSGQRMYQAIYHVPSLVKAIREDRQWARYYEVIDPQRDCAMHGVAMVYFRGMLYFNVDVRVDFGEGAEIQSWAWMVKPGQETIQTPRAISEIIKSSATNEEAITEFMQWSTAWSFYMAIASEASFCRTVSHTSKPKRENRRRRRLRQQLEARSAQIKHVTLIPHADLTLAKRGDPLPPSASHDQSAPTRLSWAPPHTGIRWVREDNVRDDDVLIDLKERNGRIYYACNRPIRGWGESPCGARQIHHTLKA